MKDKAAVAITGIGGIFPGAPELSDFWNIIRDGIDQSRSAPEGRWILPSEQAVSSQDIPEDGVFTDRGCFIDEFNGELDSLGFSSEIIRQLDPMFHLALVASHRAFQDGKLDQIDRSRVGVILGNIALPTETSSKFSEQILGPLFTESIRIPDKWDVGEVIHPLNRLVAGMPAGLVAMALSLGGRCFTLDAACASSLYALKYAADELLSGRADAMLTGGLSRPDCLYTQMGFTQLRALSRRGICSPFDESGDGLLVGEGAGIVVLKRLADAVEQGDFIYGVIRGIGLSNDVEGNLLSPDSEGQLRAMRQAYELAGWRPEQVDLIECHGTGTPLGDQVEFRSLKQLWKDYKGPVGSCVLGAVKSNIGHLLTGAGAAGLIKTLLALKNRTLPPIANFERAHPGLGLEESPFRILKEAESWDPPAQSESRKAAVSAFGFGGINAHVLIEEWTSSNRNLQKDVSVPFISHSESEPIAIVGMDAWAGPWKGLDSIEKRLFGNDEREAERIESRWWNAQSRLPELEGLKGYTLESLEIPLKQFRIPPKEIPSILPQQLIMLMVADGALKNLQSNTLDPVNSGVFIGIELDLGTTHFHLRWALYKQAKRWASRLGYEFSESEFQVWLKSLRDEIGDPLSADRTLGALGGIVASRLAREFRFGGPCHTVSSEETSGINALDLACEALRKMELGHALVGAVDMAGDLRSVWGSLKQGRYTQSDGFLPFCEESEGSQPGEGAVALVLKRYSDAQKDGDRVYALLRGIGASNGGDVLTSGVSVEAGQAAMSQAYERSGVDCRSIDYLDLHGSGIPAEDKVEAKVISRFFMRPDIEQGKLPLRLGTAKTEFGHLGVASGLLSVTKVALCLFRNRLPGQPCEGTMLKSLKEDDRFCFPEHPQYWLKNQDQGKKRAAVNAIGAGGSFAHVILESVDHPSASTGVREELLSGDALPARLIVVEAGDRVALLGKLHEIQEDLIQLKNPDFIQSLRLGTDVEPKCRLAIVVEEEGGTRALLEQAIKLVSQSEPSHSNTDSTALFYSEKGLSHSGGIGFVFPGSGNHFMGMGRELAMFHPDVLEKQEKQTDVIASQWLPDWFWDFNPSRQLDDHPEVLIFGQVTLGTLVTDVLEDYGIRPSAAIGYSLGETAALFSTRAWTERDEMVQRVRESSLFTKDLGGPCLAAKRKWNLDEDQSVEWMVGVVNRNRLEVEKAIENFSKVYLLIVNSPEECVIGGDRSEVEKLVRNLQAGWVPVPGVPTVHCDVVESVEVKYRELHRLKINVPEGIRFYSGAWGESYDLTSERAVDSITAQALHGLNFQKTILSAYEDGVRFFVEMGPGNSCSRMIRTILKDKDFATRPIVVENQSEVLNLIRLVAHLHVEGFSIDFSSSCLKELTGWGSAFQSETSPVDNQLILVPLGRPEFRRIPLPEPFKPKTEPNKKTPVTLNSNPSTAAIEIDGLHPSPSSEFQGSPLIGQMNQTLKAGAAAHQAFLEFSDRMTRLITQSAQMPTAVLQGSQPEGDHNQFLEELDAPAEPGHSGLRHRVVPEVLFDREQCMAIAIGRIADVLGDKFAAVDGYPTRVRLPDEPLMLVDRILTVEGEPCSMKSGRVVTEHDVLPDGWYLDGGRIPTCIAVEAGQADLFLSGYLGIDFQTKGLAVYRLLDADVTFHDTLPGPNSVIHYDIHIDEFFRQGNTWLFRFNFEGTVDGNPLISMEKGCAGFFTEQELDGGKGIVHTEFDLREMPGIRQKPWVELVPMVKESYTDSQLNQLREGNLSGCFGVQFSRISLRRPFTIPGGRMHLVDRVLEVDPSGGRFGMGLIRAEADIHPDDWFLTCHFVDDRVMPGTLMYECCLHTLRIFLIRMGWVGETGRIVVEPVPGVCSALKCRGQVLESTKKVLYEIVIKELGYGPEPYAIVDALMYADGKAIVEISNMSARFNGTNLETLTGLWGAVSNVSEESQTNGLKRPPLFDTDRILAFAIGKPSVAFGKPYEKFDKERKIARLPGPPYQFLDRIVEIDAEPWQMKAGGVITAEYDVPPDAWYFSENQQGDMPFSILLEVALQPCGWLAAYIGSALTSETDICFRNLGGKGVLRQAVFPDCGVLETTVKITNVSHSGGMIIQHYDLKVHNSRGEVYQGNTYFGFFSKAALKDQVGIRDAPLHVLSDTEKQGSEQFSFPQDATYPVSRMRMVDSIDALVENGGPHGLGYIRGLKSVDPNEWFFKAHFYQDPVCPGSLGLESFLQLLKVFVRRKWPVEESDRIETIAVDLDHEWNYRGQIIPEDHQVTVEAYITEINEETRTIKADGFLTVDGRVIYGMKNFSAALRKGKSD